MNRTTLTFIAIAALTATIAAAAVQGQTAASGERDYGYADSSYTTSFDRTAGGRSAQSARAVTPVAGSPQTIATQDWPSELDGRVARQEAALDTVLTRTQYFVAVLMLLVGGTIAYLWVRLAQLAAKCDRLQACFDSPADTQSGNVTPPSNVTAEKPAAKRRVSADAVRPAAASGIPRVQVLAGVVDCLVAGINESRRRRGDVETGYALVGKITGEGVSRVINLSGLIDEGPNAARSGGHHKADRDYQQRELDLLQLVDGDVMHIGDAHLHPGSMDTCSGGDHRTDLGNVKASRSLEMVFVIATAASAHWAGRSEDSIHRDGLKLDFFYMGRSSGYEYRHFRPEIVRGPSLSAPTELRRFAAADPVRAKLDFENLRRLTAYRMTVGELPAEGGTGRACIEMAHRSRGFKTIIAFSADPGGRPEVFVDTGSQVMQFQPAWLNGGWTPGLVWFTPIVLDVEREITGRRVVAGSGRDIEATAGGRSAPAEAKVTGPTNGETHGKLPAIE